MAKERFQEQVEQKKELIEVAMSIFRDKIENSFKVPMDDMKTHVNKAIDQIDNKMNEQILFFGNSILKKLPEEKKVNEVITDSQYSNKNSKNNIVNISDLDLIVENTLKEVEEFKKETLKDYIKKFEA